MFYITCNRSVNIFLFGSKGSESGAAGRASKSILYSILFPITQEQVTVVSLLMGCFAQVYMSHTNLDNLNKQYGLTPQLSLLHIPISNNNPRPGEDNCLLSRYGWWVFGLDCINTRSWHQFYTPMSIELAHPFSGWNKFLKLCLNTSWQYKDLKVTPPHVYDDFSLLISSPTTRVLVLHNTIVRYQWFSKSSALPSVVSFTDDIFPSSLAFVPFA